MHICAKIIIPTLLVLPSCAANQRFYPEISVSTSYESCVSGEYCSVSGLVEKKRIGDIDVGIFNFDEKNCITLSFSKKFFMNKTFPLNGKFTGRVYQWEHDPLNYVLLKINGREIPHSPCKETYLFIE
jgi:hypothetical protein